MMLVFMVLAVILSVALIVLVTIQPRQTQIFSTDATSNIGKPSYWASQPIRKMLRKSAFDAGGWSLRR